MSGAPQWLGPLAALTLAQGGDRDGARQLLVALAATSDGYIRQAAERRLAQLQALDDIDRLQALLRDHFARTGEYPRSLVDLRIPTPSGVLADPAGRPYAYDAPRGIVGLAADSPLAPLPRTFDRR
jgi:hypothetical protein